MNIPLKHNDQILRFCLISAVSLLLCLECLLGLGGCKLLKHENDLVDMKQYRFELNGIPVRCWVACDINQHRHGLRGQARKIVNPDAAGEKQGMCFVYPSERILVFTMKDVFAPLDVAFISAGGTLIHMESMTPDAKKLYSWHEPAMFALELAPGTLEKTALKPGDTFFSPADCAALKTLCSSNAP